MSKVWIVIYHNDSEPIKGVFSTKEQAKLFIADFVLENDINTEYLQLTEHQVIEQ